MMRSPIRDSGTPGPTSAIRPTASAPWTWGNLIPPADQVADSAVISAKPSRPPSAVVPSVTSLLYQPVRVLMSVLLRPQAPTRIRTSPGPGFGVFTSVR